MKNYLEGGSGLLFNSPLPESCQNEYFNASWSWRMGMAVVLISPKP